MKKLFLLVPTLLFSLTSLPGCIVLRDGRTRYVPVVAATPECRPSQYWDGHECRHKGKGHGARKHDGDDDDHGHHGHHDDD